MEAARLALCEEAVLRDLLRRCGVALPPGYARADAVNMLRSGRNKNGGGGLPQHLSAPPSAAAAAAASAAAEAAAAKAAAVAAAGSGSRARGNGGVGGGRGASRSKGGKSSKGSSRRNSLSASGSGKPKNRGTRRRKSETLMDVRVIHIWGDRSTQIYLFFFLHDRLLRLFLRLRTTG